MNNYFRISSCVPKLSVANTIYNTDKIIEKMIDASNEGSCLAVFPELCITSYTCGDLFFQSSLNDGVIAALERILEESIRINISVVVGAPLNIDGALYNCGLLISEGKIRGIVPKTFIPNHAEFSEKRWFESSRSLTVDEISITQLGIRKFGDYYIPVGSDLIFNLNNSVKLGIELCEDLWAPLPPSTFAALNGADVIVNLSASNEVVGKRKYREELVKSQSSKLICGYVFTSSGCDESTSDLVFSGHSIISENGSIIAENSNIIDNDYLISADFDIEKIKAERIKNNTFKDAAQYNLYDEYRIVDIISDGICLESDGSLCKVKKMPFVPSLKNERIERCHEIFEMQVAGLKKRVEVTNSKLVIGVSGGLDSTLALLVCCEVMRRLNRPLTDVYGITMPCFGTSDRTLNNSLILMQKLGISTETIDIKNSCMQHFSDIGHNIDVLDATYENSQARERTQVLMDYASRIGGFVVGTGDLSELALGWCTYNGDHMSMYGVNSNVPKTLIRWIIDYIIEKNVFSECSNVLSDILDTPISPELLPPDSTGKIAQVTEDIVGPYALHDFFMYYVLRYGFNPTKIYHLARHAFIDEFDDDTILKWLKTFYRRFFTQQFKRNCLPDGVKIGRVGISPRSDFRMPSDASSKLWLDEIENLK